MTMFDPWGNEPAPVSPVAPDAPVSGGGAVVTGAGVLDAVREWLDRFIVVVDDGDLDVLTLWAAHTHLAEETYTSPRLAIDSPVPGSGKTTVLEHLHRLCVNPVQAASLSSSALLVRLLKDGIRTVLIDEADRSLSKDNPLTTELLAILNSGYKRGGTRPVLTPSKGSDWVVEEMSTYSPVAMAGNNPDLPDDTRSRCIRVLLMPDIDATAEESDWELIEDEAIELARRLSGWADAVRLQVRTRPTLPEQIKGRARERWGPLKRVATAAGGRWPAVVDALAVADVERIAQQREEGIAVERPHLALLRHLHITVGSESFVGTEELIDRLVSNWPEVWGDSSPFGKRLTAQRLGRMLSTHYNITTSRLERTGPRGYTRASLTPAFRQFGLDPSDKPAHPVQTAQPAQHSADLGLGGAPGRCESCGWHVLMQGHRAGCPGGDAE